MKPEVYKELPAVIAAVQNPRSVRSVLNYMTGADASDPVVREGLSTDAVVGELMEIWFASGTKLDELAQPFAPVIRELKAGTLVEPEWQGVEGKIAKVLLGDQLARNCFRGTAEAFSYDPLTKVIVEELVSPECISETLKQPCAILYLLPWALAHQEDLNNLVRAVEVVDMAIAAYPDFNLFTGRSKLSIDQHRAVLKHFGRYPHRNAELGRENTPEEQAWLNDDGARPGWTPGGKLAYYDKIFDQLEGSYTLVYHGAMAKFLGRGWAPMMVLEEAGATYECKAPEDKPPVTFAPPMVITPGGAKVSQVVVCCMALGKDLGLWPKDLASDIKALQYSTDAADMLSESFSSKPPERLAKWFAHFEAALEQPGAGPFLFGDKVTAADYAVFAALVMASGKDEVKAELEKCKKVSAFVAKMKEQKGYLAVDAKKLPLMP